MARTQAEDYEHRRDEIVARAAALFAAQGFHGTSISELAEACGTSKSLLYHYYASKEDILFDAMHDHVKALLDAAEEVAKSKGAPEQKLRQLTHRFMALYLTAAANQRVLVNELRHLPAARRKTIVGIQRRLLDIVEEILIALRPALAREPGLKRPATMLYFGMINWMHTWLDPKGPATPASIADLTVTTFIEGLRKGALHRADYGHAGS
jgi:AcrR family transcriptional regulator